MTVIALGLFLFTSQVSNLTNVSVNISFRTSYFDLSDYDKYAPAV
jgi:hypothetical protein